MNKLHLQTLQEFPIVILCGGKSSRMGEDKTLLPFGEYNSLIQFQYNRISSFFSHVFLSTKNHKFDFIKENNPSILYDNNNDMYSPLIALKSILEQINNDKIFILTVDTPFVEISTLIKLIEESENYEITVASFEDKVQNLCGVFSQSLLEKIEDMLNNDIHKIGFLLKKSETKIIDFMAEEEFINLNTKSEYYRALEILKGKDIYT